MAEAYDVIIIGTGAGGGTLAVELAPTGKRILLLERGGYLPREPENWDSREVFGKNRYVADERWYDKHGQPFRPHAQYYVGGNTKVYGAILFRMREGDFGEVKHFDGISPAWPLSYTDFEPYYTEAERLYLVHGERGADSREDSHRSSESHAEKGPEEIHRRCRDREPDREGFPGAHGKSRPAGRESERARVKRT